MSESAEDLYRRVQESGLRMPPVHEWDTFPFDGDMRPRPLRPPEDEQPRQGESEADCRRCQSGDENAIWSDERWLVTPPQEANGLPVVMLLFPRAHVDIGDLSEDDAAELGRMLIRVERAVRHVPNLGRVHVCRWGDGGAHLHWWFMARPARFPQLIGSFAAVWDEILPRTPEDVWRENLATVAAALAADGGVAHV